MDRRSFIRSAGLSAAAWWLRTLPSVAAPLTDSPSRKPNVVILFADDWGWGDLGCHGNKQVSTPNLDKLASQGTDFWNFNVCNPVCSPSRTALMTGHFPARYCIHEHFAGIESNRSRGMPDWLDPQAVMLPRLFKGAGYKTGHFGKWHLTNTGCGDAPLPSEYGYDESAVFNGPGPQLSPADSGTYDKAVEFIQKYKDSPFFVNVWMHETHTPHFPKKQFLKNFEGLDDRHKVYAAVVAEGDHGVGRVMKALDELGLADNTIVIFSADNGPEVTAAASRQAGQPVGEWKAGVGLDTYYSVGTTGGLRGRKRSLFEGGVRTPFIVRWPGRTPAGQRNEKTVLTGVDMLPTLCKAAGIELPSEYKPDGEDMLESFLGKPIQRRKPIFWEWKGTAAGDNWPRLGVRDGDMKLVMNYDGSRKELHNVSQDRTEATNIALSNPDIVNKYSQMVLDWQKTLPEQPAARCISKFRKKAGAKM